MSRKDSNGSQAQVEVTANSKGVYDGTINETKLIHAVKEESKILNVILKKMMIAVVSTLILCLILSFIGYTPKSEQELYSSYMTFMGAYTLYFILAAPMFLTVGVLFSIVAERKIKIKLFLLLSYAISGGIAGLLYYFLIVAIQANSSILGEEIILFLVVGVFSALLFYMVQLIMGAFFKKVKYNSLKGN